jgi:hypothetical protein
MDRRPDRLAVPVFVQSSWRTASTWMWAKLRRAPTATAYCEIFHERLNACTIPNLKEDHFAKWNSKHPEAAPYFLEFAPLVDASGAVRGFDPSMAIERFIPAGALTARSASPSAPISEGSFRTPTRIERYPS